MKRTSPTQRSLQKMRAEGYLCAIVEHWNPFVRVRQDLFGFIDLIAIKGDETIAIQTTVGAKVSTRLAKIRGVESATWWLASKTRRIIIHGWQKRGPRGQVKRWGCRQLEVLPIGERELGQAQTNEQQP